MIVLEKKAKKNDDDEDGGSGETSVPEETQSADQVGQPAPACACSCARCSPPVVVVHFFLVGDPVGRSCCSGGLAHGDLPDWAAPVYKDVGGYR